MSKKNDKRSTFWCRWTAPTSIPDEHMVEKWPAGMKAWISGYDSDGNRIWCARVDANSAANAEALIRECYGASGERIAIDFIEEKPLGWRPSGGRFPE